MAEAITYGSPGRTLADPAPAYPGRSPLPAVSAPEAEGPQQFKFTGSGDEYFRIWIVNLLLTIVTFGIYSAWAKVRRLQYFYRNTRVAGAIFDYHGNPRAILKGRILALVLLGAYNIAFNLSTLAAALVGLVLLCIMPWLLARSFRFKLANSSHCGVRFRFDGTVAQAYRTLSLLPVILAIAGFFLWSVAASYMSRLGWSMLVIVILMLLVLGAMVPAAYYLMKRYQHDHAYFGQSPFFFHARAAEFFKIYGRAVGLFFLGVCLATFVAFFTVPIQVSLHDSVFGWLFDFLFGVFSLYMLYLFVRPFLESRIQNLVWDNTELGMTKFESSARARTLFGIHVSNLALIILTLGLYKPFATVRLVRYRVESMAWLPPGNAREFLASQSGADDSAVGQEAGDLFNFDIAL